MNLRPGSRVGTGNDLTWTRGYVYPESPMWRRYGRTSFGVRAGRVSTNSTYDLSRASAYAEQEIPVVGRDGARRAEGASDRGGTHLVR